MLGSGCHFLLQGIFLIRLNLCLSSPALVTWGLNLCLSSPAQDWGTELVSFSSPALVDGFFITGSPLEAHWLGLAPKSNNGVL